MSPLTLTPTTPTALSFLEIAALGWFNVKDHDAAGDGVTDDTASINAAKTAVSDAGGGVLFFPQGTYLYNSTSQLQLPVNTVILGAGVTTILKLTGTGNGYLWLNAAKTELRDLTIQRGNATVGRLVHITAAKCALRNVYFDGNGFAGNCVTTNPGAANTRITGCIFDGINGHGIAAAAASGLRIVDNEWKGHLGTGSPITLNTSATTNSNTRFVISDNVVVSDPTATGTSMLLVTSTASDVLTHGVVSNNYIESASFAIVFQLTAAGTRPGKVSITGNTCKSIAGSFAGISLGNADGVAITGNTIDANSITGLATGIEVNNSNYCTVAGNVIYGDGSFADGIILNGASYCAVTGNAVYGWKDTAGNDGIRIYTTTTSSNDNTVVGNTVKFPTAATTATVGITVFSNNASGHADRNVISGNVVRGNGAASSRGIRLEAATGTVDKTLVIGNTNTNVTTAIHQTSDTNTLLSGTNWNQT